MIYGKMYTDDNVIIHDNSYWEYFDEIIPEGMIAYSSDKYIVKKGTGTKTWNQIPSYSNKLFETVFNRDTEDAGDVIRDYFYEKAPDGQLTERTDLKKIPVDNDVFIVRRSANGMEDDIYRYDKESGKWIFMQGHEGSTREIEYDGGVAETPFWVILVIMVILGLILMWIFENSPSIAAAVFFIAVIGFFFIRPFTK